MTGNWPVTELDPVRRMRVLAAATPGVAYAERLIPAPFSAVWEIAGDLEHELPHLLRDVRSFEISSIRGERMTARARGRLTACCSAPPLRLLARTRDCIRARGRFSLCVCRGFRG